MEEIIIGGYKLEELKKVQAAVKKDASEIISEAIDKATNALDEILSMEGDVSGEDLDPEYEGYAEALATVTEARAKVAELSTVAEEALKLAKLVSDISGVEYYLPYSCDYSRDGYYYKLESSEICEEISDELMGTLEDMEWESRQWNQSNC